MKILLVSHEMTYTGAPRSLLNPARVLSELQYQVDVWTMKAGNFQKEYDRAGYPVRLLPGGFGGCHAGQGGDPVLQYLYGGRRELLFPAGNERELAWKMRQLTSRKRLLLEGVKMRGSYAAQGSVKPYRAAVRRLVTQK